MKQFTGNDLRELRKRNRLKRSEIAQYLNVSPVTIEKWEQRGDEKIRPKYLDRISTMAGMGAAGLGIGLLAAPAALPFAAIMGSGAILSAFAGDDELEQAGELIDGLRKLSPTERKKFLNLVKKMRA